MVLILAGLVALGVLGGAAGLAYLFLRDAPPPAVGTASGSPGASAPTSTGGTVPIATDGAGRHRLTVHVLPEDDPAG
jgi:hypothetical protein